MGFLVAFVKDVPFVTGRTRFVGTLGVGALDGLVLRLAELFITHFAGGHLGLLFLSFFNLKKSILRRGTPVKFLFLFFFSSLLFSSSYPLQSTRQS
jgi:hypothetical protein